MNGRVVGGVVVAPLALVALIACASVQDRASKTAYMTRMAIPSAPTEAPMYPLKRAFGAHAVPLTSRQRAWILRIARSRSYRAIANQLYFVNAPGSSTPIIVLRRYPHGGMSTIIGDWCQHYTPGVGASFGPSGPCAKPRSLDP